MQKDRQKGARTQMQVHENRQSAESDLETIQSNNRRWWTNHTMSYDWKDKVETERFTEAWFAEID
jgi:hypothetical protein